MCGSEFAAQAPDALFGLAQLDFGRRRFAEPGLPGEPSERRVAAARLGLLLVDLCLFELALDRVDIAVGCGELPRGLVAGLPALVLDAADLGLFGLAFALAPRGMPGLDL